MEVLDSSKNIIPFDNSILTVGSYDGIHLGHKEILSKLVKKSKIYNLNSVLVTFDPHPRSVLNRDSNNHSLIMNLEQKLRIIEDLGVDFVYIIKFTTDFSKITATEFMSKIIVPNFHPKIILTGVNHFFGKNRQGSPDFLKKYCHLHSIDLIVIEPVLNGQSEISSSNIRGLISSGFIIEANNLLGTYFSIEGLVVHGSGRGSLLNFQTANILPKEKKQLLPKKGVYLVLGRINGLNRFGMCNIGIRPTFGENKLVMEIHFFLDEILNLYGKRIKIKFLERIRDEKKFPSSKDLVNQLENDKMICLNLSSKYK
tara:strand:+ start:25 stop:963 length:939 start_codon:yes stop_codon:yes gene_type:complete